MTPGATVWMVIFVIAAAAFFGVAAIVSVLGVQDIKDLLRPHRQPTRGNHS